MATGRGEVEEGNNEAMTALRPEQLLGEIEELIRTIPEREHFRQQQRPEVFAWSGRAKAVMSRWDAIRSIPLGIHLAALQTSSQVQDPWIAYAALKTLLQEAHYDLRLDAVGPVNVAIGQGQVFDYFDTMRNVISLATTEILFIDRYLDAEFISRFLPLVRDGVTARLLARETVPSLVAAAKAYSQQRGSVSIAIRSSDAIHDRFVFVDRAACYHSGASFKDGAKSSPTIISQITDAFAAIQQTYEGLWQAGSVEL